MTVDMSGATDADFQARVDRIEAGQAAEESAVEKVARAIEDADATGNAEWEDLARAAIDAMRGPAPADDPGYHVELGGQRFTQTQWEALQPYIEGRLAAVSEDAATWTP